MPGVAVVSLAHRPPDPRRILAAVVIRIRPVDHEARLWRTRIMTDALLLLAERCHRDAVALIEDLQDEAFVLRERIEDAQRNERAWAARCVRAVSYAAEARERGLTPASDPSTTGTDHDA